MTNAVELGGRRFVRADVTTVDQDIWVMAQVRAAGIDSLEYSGNPADAVDRLISITLASGKTTLLLAGLLLPEGMEPENWTPAVAEDTARHLGRLKDFQDKSQVRPLLAAMLAGFFRSGLVSLWISQSSSSLVNQAGEPEKIGGENSLGNGGISSASSVAGTRAATAAS